MALGGKPRVARGRGLVVLWNGEIANPRSALHFPVGELSRFDNSQNVKMIRKLSPLRKGPRRRFFWHTLKHVQMMDDGTF
jgi:hypothetical protein